MKKEQQNPEDQQAAKSAMEHAEKQERVHTAQKNIEFCLIPFPRCPLMTNQKHCWMNDMIWL